MVQVEEQTADYTNLITDTLFDEWLRFDGTDQDNVKPIIIESAIRTAENYCNATFGLKTYKAQFDDVCYGRKYWLPFGKVISVEKVYYVDAEGTQTELTLNDNYYVGGLTNKWIRIVGNTYSTGSSSYSSYLVEYTTGYSDPSTVNPLIKEGILKIASESFENREDSVLGESVTIFPDSSRIKLNPFRNRVL